MPRPIIPLSNSPRAAALSRRVVRILIVSMLLMATRAAATQAAPPPDASGKFADWFRSLTIPGNPGAPCCTVADCRMVEATWNDRTRHYEARVMRENFSSGLGRQILSAEDDEAFQAAKIAWTERWVRTYGDRHDVWIEIPDATVNPVQNPTGHAVLCWSLSNSQNNGVYCFMPFIAAFNDLFKSMNAVV